MDRQKKIQIETEIMLHIIEAVGCNCAYMFYAFDRYIDRCNTQCQRICKKAENEKKEGRSRVLVISFYLVICFMCHFEQLHHVCCQAEVRYIYQQHPTT